VAGNTRFDYICRMIRIEQVSRPDRSEARRLLACLGERYPGGLDWLERRLDDVEADRAQIWRAALGATAVGYAIASPKGRRRTKLSTIYVAPRARGFGVGRGLLANVARDWWAREVEQAFVTVDEGDHATRSFLAANGYASLPDGRRAYGDRFDVAYAAWPELLGAPELPGAIDPPYPAAAHPN